MKLNSFVSSKLLDKKWKEKDLLMHKRKLRDMKSAGVSSKTRAPQVLIANPKKDAMLEGKSNKLKLNFLLVRYTEIERENRILLEKMSNIMQKHQPSLYNPNQLFKPSLNREIRKKELLRITIEN